jgi:hypothetical protein
MTPQRRASARAWIAREVARFQGELDEEGGIQREAPGTPLDAEA